MAKKAAGEGVYRVIDIIGTSKRSWEDATKNAVETATRSLRDLRIAEIQKLDVKIANGKIAAYRAREQSPSSTRADRLLMASQPAAPSQNARGGFFHPWPARADARPGRRAGAAPDEAGDALGPRPGARSPPGMRRRPGSDRPRPPPDGRGAEAGGAKAVRVLSTSW